MRLNGRKQRGQEIKEQDGDDAVGNRGPGVIGNQRQIIVTDFKIVQIRNKKYELTKEEIEDALKINEEKQIGVASLR